MQRERSLLRWPAVQEPGKGRHHKLLPSGVKAAHRSAKRPLLALSTPAIVPFRQADKTCATWIAQAGPVLADTVIPAAGDPGILFVRQNRAARRQLAKLNSRMSCLHVVAILPPRFPARRISSIRRRPGRARQPVLSTRGADHRCLTCRGGAGYGGLLLTNPSGQTVIEARPCRGAAAGAALEFQAFRDERVLAAGVLGGAWTKRS